MDNIRKQMIALCAAVVETLDESKDDLFGGVPSGLLYAGLMGAVDLDGYNTIITTLKNAGMVEESMHVLRLTEQGKKLAQEIKLKRAQSPASTL